MLILLGQLPIWIFGIFGIIASTHTTRAELIRAQRESNFLAYHDALTGLPNRLLLMKRLDEECARVASEPERSSYVLYLDLDGFKAVNDNFGHGAGDDLLRAVASRFSLCMRPCDTLGRLGGDEFAAILPQTAVETVEAVAHQLIACTREPFTFEGIPLVRIGVSIGGASLSSPPDVRRTLEVADTMLYAAKHAGKGTLRLG